jgi:hypothetical protein
MLEFSFEFFQTKNFDLHAEVTLLIHYISRFDASPELYATQIQKEKKKGASICLIHIKLCVKRSAAWNELVR